jgi:hypothetical protein
MKMFVVLLVYTAWVEIQTHTAVATLHHLNERQNRHSAFIHSVFMSFVCSQRRVITSPNTISG